MKSKAPVGERLWGPKELAWFLGISEKNARAKMAEPQSPGFRVGKLYRIHPDDALSFYSSRRVVRPTDRSLPSARAGIVLQNLLDVPIV